MLGVKIQNDLGDTALVTDGKLEVSVTGVSFPDANLYIPGVATDATLGSVLTATQAVVSSVGLLGSQVTLSAILTKIPLNGATAANQSTQTGHLANILNAVDSIDSNVSKEITSNAILAKLSNDPATASLQGTINTSIGEVKTAVEAVTTKIISASTTIGQYNIIMTTINTEYSQALPTGCRGFEFWTRSGELARFAFTTGKVATPTDVYFTLLRGATYQSTETLDLTGKTLYVASATAGDVIELITWS